VEGAPMKADWRAVLLTLALGILSALVTAVVSLL
jgi:hypothetical protein